MANGRTDDTAAIAAMARKRAPLVRHLVIQHPITAIGQMTMPSCEPV